MTLLSMGSNQNGKSHRQVKLIFFTIITVKFNLFFALVFWSMVWSLFIGSFRKVAIISIIHISETMLDDLTVIVLNYIR